MTESRHYQDSRRKRVKIVDDINLGFHNRVNTSLEKLHRRQLADYLIQKSKLLCGDQSLMGTEEMSLAKDAFCDTSDWTQPRILDHLPAFLERFASNVDGPKHLSIAPKPRGTPHTIVVCAAGLRAADVTRSLRVFQTNDSIVAKLFAKHKKLVDAIEYVKSTRMGIAVGTPARIIALMDSGCLSSDELKRIVVDFSNIDQKNRGILDMKETQVPLMQLLTRAELKHRFGQAIGGLDLLFF